MDIINRWRELLIWFAAKKWVSDWMDFVILIFEGRWFNCWLFLHSKWMHNDVETHNNSVDERKEIKVGRRWLNGCF